MEATNAAGTAYLCHAPEFTLFLHVYNEAHVMMLSLSLLPLFCRKCMFYIHCMEDMSKRPHFLPKHPHYFFRINIILPKRPHFFIAKTALLIFFF